MRTALRLVLLSVILTSCAPALHAGHIVIDCLATNQSQLQALIAAMLAKAPDWGAIEHQAIDAGEAVGGCALAEVVLGYLTPPPGRAAPSLESGRAARATLERFRATYAGGAVFRTPQGDL